MLLTFPPIILAAGLFGRKIRTLARTTQQELANTNTIVEETLQAINSVKAFTNEQFETQRYTSSLDKVVTAALRSNLFRGRLRVVHHHRPHRRHHPDSVAGGHAGLQPRPRPPRSQPAAHVSAVHHLHRGLHCGSGRDVRQGAEHAGRLGAHPRNSGRNARAHPRRAGHAAWCRPASRATSATSTWPSATPPAPTCRCSRTSASALRRARKLPSWAPAARAKAPLPAC